MVQSAAHGEEGGWQLVPLRQFLPAQPVDRTKCLPSTHMLDFTAKTTGCMVFSKFNLRKGYHQIPVNPRDVQKTNIILPLQPL
jgi:hypothetical protein